VLRADGTGGSTVQSSPVSIGDGGEVSTASYYESVVADPDAWKVRLSNDRLEFTQSGTLPVSSTVQFIPSAFASTGALSITNPDATGTREILLDGVAEFTQLADTPANYTGQAGKVVAVKGAEDGLEFITAGTGTIGGSVGTVDNAIPRANGTGGSTLQGSDVSITDAGEVKFADGINGGAGQSLGGLIVGNGGASSATHVGGRGGYIYMTGGTADSTGEGGDAGSIFMIGGDAASGNGVAAGNINTSASFGLNGGSIMTAGGGGSIDTTMSGSIQLGSAGTRTTILGAAASDWNLTLPTGMGNLGEVLTTNGSGTTSWAVPAEATAALGLKTATTTVSVSGAAAPTSGQVLTATSGTAATWQTPTGGGGLTNITETLNTASPNNTVNAEQLAVTSGTTNVNLVLTPRGTGGFMLGAPPDGTATGGNIIGVRAVDLQLNHGGIATRVASGSDSFAAGTSNTASGTSSASLGSSNTSSGNETFTAGNGNSATSNQAVALGFSNTASNFTAIAIGRTNTASGSRSIALGVTNTASAQSSVSIGEENNASGAQSKATGYRALADRYGLQSRAAGFFAAVGDAQSVLFVARNKTTTNSAVTLFLDGSSTRLTVPSGKILHLQVTLLGSKSDGAAVASYMRQVTIKNVAGTTSLVGTVNTIGTDEAAGTSIAITADDTNDALQIAVTGITSETWRWVAVVEGVEMAYGT
jgi:hypothetical protein